MILHFDFQYKVRSLRYFSLFSKYHLIIFNAHQKLEIEML